MTTPRPAGRTLQAGVCRFVAAPTRCRGVAIALAWSLRGASSAPGAHGDRTGLARRSNRSLGRSATLVGRRSPRRRPLDRQGMIDRSRACSRPEAARRRGARGGTRDLRRHGGLVVSAGRRTLGRPLLPAGPARRSPGLLCRPTLTPWRSIVRSIDRSRPTTRRAGPARRPRVSASPPSCIRSSRIRGCTRRPRAAKPTCDATTSTRFKEGIAPLADAGKLGALLAQFPASFKADDEAATHLEDLVRQFADYQPGGRAATPKLDRQPRRGATAGGVRRGLVHHRRAKVSAVGRSGAA